MREQASDNLDGVDIDLVRRIDAVTRRQQFRRHYTYLYTFEYDVEYAVSELTAQLTSPALALAAFGHLVGGDTV